MISETNLTEKLARAHRADVIYFPFNIMPKVSIPSVLLVHDLVNEFYSARFPLYRPLYYQTVKTLVRKSIRRAGNLLTISNAIAEELKKSGLTREPQKIFVAPLASQPISEMRRPPALCFENKKIILQTGDHLPHKNHITGLRAMAFLSKTYPHLAEKLHLVLTGGFIRDEKLRRYVSENKIEQNVSFLGKVSDEELEWLMQKSEVVCFPTLYEGFGLGIVESQKRGKPLIVSDIPVLREVSDNTAIFFEPENYIELGEKIKAVIERKSDNKSLIDKGLQNASSRSWESHVEKVIEVLEYTGGGLADIK
jgi:glycosyltransferase involved in cell wall biosynthesis